jgi:hypothetical protein
VTFNSRIYVYKILPDGSKEFLHTFLDTRSAEKYCEKYKKLFGESAGTFLIGSHSTDIWKTRGDDDNAD